MNFDDMVAKLEVTRTRIEAEVSKPAVLTITSATERDGASLLATALAYGLERVGHAVLLVDASSTVPTGNQRPVMKAVSAGDVDVLTFVREGARNAPDHVSLDSGTASSRETVNAMLARFRSKYAFTIISAGVPMEDALALSLTAAADHVLIAFEDGRSARSADREFMRILESVNASPLGVVSVSPRSIREFKGGISGSLNAAPAPLAIRHLDENVAKSSALGVRAG